MGRVRGEDLSCYSNKIQSVVLGKISVWSLTCQQGTATNVCRSFTYNMAAKTSRHGCGTKLRNCHPVYWTHVILRSRICRRWKPVQLEHVRRRLACLSGDEMIFGCAAGDNLLPRHLAALCKKHRATMSICCRRPVSQWSVTNLWPAECKSHRKWIESVPVFRFNVYIMIIGVCGSLLSTALCSTV